ncbi:PliI family lysozyme inhibitor of I-type lysozyme [Shewanella goraebulensis]|uniref:PliI family lysozyme inhibitor of I-type lysozyme n=1 Tax=Shewanella goraebulensis TaxID=3050637 RepID=UPI0025507E91|nr:PliI family lysozyme inhibitor of I-type lysozyme [Shewanella goraebulensis]
MQLFTKTIVLISMFMLTFVSIAPAQSQEVYELTTSNGGTYVKSFTFKNGQSVVVAEGRIEPRSIGSISIKLYKDLNVGDFTQGIFIPRDGTILSVDVVEDTMKKQKLKIITATAGSGNYQAIGYFCVENEQVALCE